jgi:hypothetical protein
MTSSSRSLVSDIDAISQPKETKRPRDRRPIEPLTREQQMALIEEARAARQETEKQGTGPRISNPTR